MKLTEASLTTFERSLRMNIRNAYLAESTKVMRTEAVSRGAQGKWFEAAVLLELACEELADLVDDYRNEAYDG